MAVFFSRKVLLALAATNASRQKTLSKNKYDKKQLEKKYDKQQQNYKKNKYDQQQTL